MLSQFSQIPFCFWLRNGKERIGPSTAPARTGWLSTTPSASARKVLLLQGRVRFGKPSPKVIAAINALGDVGRLEELAVRLLDARGWEELLGLNGSARPGRGRKKS